MRTSDPILALLVLLAAAPAHAGRPLATEDADVLARGDCEIEGVAAGERESGSPTTRAWQLQAGCGIGLRSQVAINAGRSWDSTDAQRSIGLVGKTSLIEREGEGVGLTLAWGVSGVRAGSGGSYSHESSELKLVATKAWAGGWTGHANLGALRIESESQQSTTWNLALERAFAGGVDLMGEVYGDDRGDPWLAGGLRWSASGAFSVNASYGVQVQTPRVRLVTVGFKFAF